MCVCVCVCVNVPVCVRACVRVRACARVRAYSNWCRCMRECGAGVSTFCVVQRDTPDIYYVAFIMVIVQIGVRVPWLGVALARTGVRFAHTVASAYPYMLVGVLLLFACLCMPTFMRIVAWCAAPVPAFSRCCVSAPGGAREGCKTQRTLAGRRNAICRRSTRSASRAYSRMHLCLRVACVFANANLYLCLRAACGRACGPRRTHVDMHSRMRRTLDCSVGTWTAGDKNCSICLADYEVRSPESRACVCAVFVIDVTGWSCVCVPCL